VQSHPTLIENTRLHDLGDGFVVRRMLPALLARHIGPFVFYDHMGPAEFMPGKGMDVRPHPHIGLATVTWLFEGTIRHRDTLGSLADIAPGAVNWMTAGRGIAHSERTPPDARRDGQRMHGVQVWVALPRADEEVVPEFHHHDADSLPRIQRDGAELVLIAGTAYGEASPVKVFAPMFFIEARLEAGAELAWPDEHVERGVHVVEGEVSWGGSGRAREGGQPRHAIWRRAIGWRASPLVEFCIQFARAYRAGQGGLGHPTVWQGGW
jgi:redox-sensitive bicupin YhaK (pirin superfamily)